MNAKTAESHPTLLQYRELLKNLVIKDLKVKYRNSFLGFLWSLLNPLMMIIVYSVALKYILRVQVENFPLFLIIGILPWNLFSGTAMAATEAIISNANLIKKICFPERFCPSLQCCFT
jgi:ABC-type polysaccharide/polyol phosphate export permease